MSKVTFIIPRRCLLCRRWSRTLDWVGGSFGIGDYGLRCLDRDACQAASWSDDAIDYTGI
jgi:hypothetical protein